MFVYILNDLFWNSWYFEFKISLYKDDVLDLNSRPCNKIEFIPNEHAYQLNEDLTYYSIAKKTIVLNKHAIYMCILLYFIVFYSLDEQNGRLLLVDERSFHSHLLSNNKLCK